MFSNRSVALSMVVMSPNDEKIFKMLSLKNIFYSFCDFIAILPDFDLQDSFSQKGLHRAPAPPTSFKLCSQKAATFSLLGESLALSASSKKSADALLRPCSRFFAPRSGRDSVVLRTIDFFGLLRQLRFLAMTKNLDSRRITEIA